MQNTDEKLIEQYLLGDESALSFLIERYVTPIYSFVYSMIHSEEEAEDIVQETFVKLWKNINKFKKGNHFKSWILTIARNTTYDFLRKRKHIPFSRFEDEDGKNTFEENVASNDISALESLLSSEEKKFLEKALKKISPLYQEVLALRYGSELTFEEIGDILGKPLNTVKSQHRRALIELRTLVDHAPK